MLDFFTTVFGSILSGGATGLVGVGLKMWGDYKNRQLDIQMERERRETEIARYKAAAEVAAQEWAGRTQVAKVEGEAKTETAAYEAFAKSFQMEPQRFADVGMLDKLPAWVQAICAVLMFALDWVRGVTRPALAWYLAILTTLIFYEARQILDAADGGLDTEAAERLVFLIVNTILYLFTTTVTWYFGVRNLQPPPKLY